MNGLNADPSVILAGLIFGDIDAKEAARQLGEVPDVKFHDGYHYWPADLYESGHVTRALVDLKRELTALAIEIDLPAA